MYIFIHECPNGHKNVKTFFKSIFVNREFELDSSRRVLISKNNGANGSFNIKGCRPLPYAIKKSQFWSIVLVWLIDWTVLNPMGNQWRIVTRKMSKKCWWTENWTPKSVPHRFNDSGKISFDQSLGTTHFQFVTIQTFLF